jgi:biotin carboxyl carrier protein
MNSETLHLTVEGKAYVVEVDDLTARPLSVRVNGRPFIVALRPDDAVGKGASAASPFDAAPAPETAPEGTQEMTAPMPGTILDIAVGVGDRVAHKQRLCNLEAMKMKNALRAPRKGTVVAVHVHEGQTVAHGDRLFTLE